MLLPHHSSIEDTICRRGDPFGPESTYVSIDHSPTTNGDFGPLEVKTKEVMSWLKENDPEKHKGIMGDENE